MSKLSRIKDRLGRIQPPAKEEPGTYTYITPSGKASVVYYPVTGEAKILSTYGTRETRYSWQESLVMLSAEDTIAIGIYLLGLQPHIREVLARKDNVVQEVPVEYPTPDMVDQDM
jgi:hypothetical protein